MYFSVLFGIQFTSFRYIFAIPRKQKMLIMPLEVVQNGCDWNFRPYPESQVASAVSRSTVFPSQVAVIPEGASVVFGKEGLQAVQAIFLDKLLDPLVHLIHGWRLFLIGPSNFS